MKNAFHVLISRLEIAEERTNEPEAMSAQISQSEIQREKGMKNKKAKNRMFNNHGRFSKGVTCVQYVVFVLFCF